MGSNLFIKLTSPGNLFLITNPLAEGTSESEIEHMFTEETRCVEIGGKTLSLDSKFDNTKFFGKDYFSSYVLANYKTIDFNGFRPFLNTIRTVIQEYEKPKTED